MSETLLLRLDEQLKRDGGTQARACIYPDLVAEYAGIIDDGEELDPGLAFYDGTWYWLVDGFHRAAAHEQAGQNCMRCVVRPGTQLEAQWASLAQNAKHGRKRSPSDTRRSIRAAFLMEAMSARMSDRAIARHVYCDHKTVGAVRAEMVANGELPQSHTRIGLDNRETAVTGINAGRGETGQTNSESWRADQAPVSRQTETRPPVPMATNAEKFKASEPLPFVPKAAPPGGWPVAGEDGNFDDEPAEVLVDAVAQRWCDIKILELEPETLFKCERWIAAFSIGAKPCALSEPLTEDSEEYHAYRTRDEALASAAMRLAMYCWRHIQDEAVPKTAKEVLERFRLWALRTGEVTEDQFDNQVRAIIRGEQNRLVRRVTGYTDAITIISSEGLREKENGENYERVAEMFVRGAQADPVGDEASAMPYIDKALERLTAFAAAVKAILAQQEESSVAD